jgi:hypothetical protein
MAKEKKAKKSIFKRWWFWVIALILVASVATAGDEEETSNDTASKPETVEVVETATNDKPAKKKEETTQPKEEKKEDSKAGELDAAKFNAINNGMTYEEVVAIVGGDGQVISESGEKGTEFHTVMYEWEAEGDFGANANFMFQGGKLINKAQMGVVEQSDVTVTLNEFNQIQNGMSYEEVVAIIGGEGNLLSESGEKGSEFYTVMYDYKGEGSFGANANFMFQSGKLQNKAQFGLD